MRRWHWFALAIVLAASMVIAYWDDPHHFPAFYAVFGFVAAVLLLVLAKVIGKKMLMRKEGYYDES